MKNSITVTSDVVAAFRDAVATVEDAREAAREAERHDRAVRRYREEREAAAEAAEAPWWVDVGGEGDPC